MANESLGLLLIQAFGLGGLIGSLIVQHLVNGVGQRMGDSDDCPFVLEFGA